MVRAQAMTFAMQVGLAEVWRHRGAQPAAVIGHSVGETAAAVVAGVLDLPEAARFVCRRARALRRVAGAGRMAMVGLPFQDTVARLADSARVVAAISASPRSTVVSGDGEAVKSLADRWRVEGLLVRDLHTDVAFHSHHMYEVTGEVAAAACELAPAPAEVTLYSTALDPRFDGARDSEYWVANIRQPVRFVEAIQAAIEDGHRAFLEISSHPLVAHSINETLDHLDIDDAHVAVTARRDVDELQTMSAGLAELHCAGTAVDWRRHHHHGRLLELPHQVWQHRPYWIFPTERDEVDNGGHDPSRHLLLGGASTVSGAVPQVVWQTELDPTCKPYPHEHQVLGVEIAPAAVLINTFAAAAAEPGDTTGLTDVVLRTPLAATPPRVVQVVRQGTSMRLASRIADDHAADEQSWITHCTGAINTRTRLPAGRIDHAALRDRCPTQRTWADIDAQFRQTGVGGYAFDWTLNELRHNDMEQLATITIVPPPARRADSWAPVIDAALTISAMLGTPTDADCLWMASGLDTVTFHGEPPARLIVHSRRSAASPVDTVDVLVGDDQSNIIAEATGLRFAPVLDQPGTVAAPNELVHEVVWQPLCLDEPAARPQSEHITVIGDGDLAENVAAAIRGEGVDCALLRSPTDLASVERGGDVLVAPGVARHGESADHAAQRCAWNLIHTAQQLVAARRPGSRLWCLTRDVRAAGAESSLAHAPLWGAGRIIAGEHPDMWGGVVDVDDSMFEDGARLVQLLRQAPAEDVISLRRDGVTCARLSRVNGAATGTPLECHPGGTYLITGGLGVLGLEVARWLVERGARRLVLVGRQGLPPRTRWAQVHDARRRAQIDAVVGLEALGATVRVLALDLTDPTAVGVAVDTGALELPAIRGVVHAAGVVHDDLVVNVDPESLRQVFGPKVTAAMSLHHHFPPGTLDFFVMFSSSGQLARTTGQTTYAAANSFLDALAAHRRAAGDAGTTSLGWTSWRGMGMARDNAGAMMEANARGLDDISSAEALRSWSFANRFDRAYYAVLRVLPVSPPTAATPMLRELTGVVAEDTDTDLWTDLPEQDLRDRVIEDVREQVGAELNLEPDEVDLKRPLVELGVDSVMTVALRIRLQRRYGVELPQNILWDKPTTDALARHLADQLRPPSPTAQDSTAQHDGEVVAAVSAGGHS
jgi:6-methylsalicylic acid synthase